jgi:putative transposase
LSHAGPKALEAANRRWREILAYTHGEAITVTARSVQNWMAAFRRAEAESGCGYLGLLDRVAERGNRNTRIPDASKELLEEYLKSHYAVPQAKRAAAVYRLYREECEKQGIAPIGERTFYRERARFTSKASDDHAARSAGRLCLTAFCLFRSDHPATRESSL